MIDLHIHTTKSDGLKTPHQILEKSQKIGINTISITYYNIIQAYKKIGDDDCQLIIWINMDISWITYRITECGEKNNARNEFYNINFSESKCNFAYSI